MFEYADRGSYDEITIGRNRHDLDAIEFRQRVAVDISSIATDTTILGQPVSMPLAIAPTGLSGLFHKDGEILAARAAQAFGIPYCLSTMSICSIESVREAVDAPFWFQLYLMKDRGFNDELIQRSRAAQCSALMLTLDLPVPTVRRQEIRCGLSIPPRLTFRNALDILGKPGWTLSVLLGERRTFGNLAGRMEKAGIATLAQWIGTQFDPSVTWRDVEWVRERWPGRLIVKGILDAEDARLACAVGVDALVVSNHGGRQLDGAPSSISALADIRSVTAERCEVLFDGGVLSGQDVMKALARGASACLIGKAFLYGLAAQGQQGVTKVLETIRSEFRATMGLTGKSRVGDVGPDVLLAPRR